MNNENVSVQSSVIRNLYLHGLGEFIAALGTAKKRRSIPSRVFTADLSQKGVPVDPSRSHPCQSLVLVAFSLPVSKSIRIPTIFLPPPTSSRVEPVSNTLGLPLRLTQTDFSLLRKGSEVLHPRSWSVPIGRPSYFSRSNSPCRLLILSVLRWFHRFHSCESADGIVLEC